MQVGRYGPEEFDFSRDRVTASVSESLKRLQVHCYGRAAPPCVHVLTKG